MKTHLFIENSYCEWLIQPSVLNSSQRHRYISLHFSRMATECSYDYLFVYDGDHHKSELLGSFSGRVGDKIFMISYNFVLFPDHSPLPDSQDRVHVAGAVFRHQLCHVRVQRELQCPPLPWPMFRPWTMWPGPGPVSLSSRLHRRRLHPGPVSWQLWSQCWMGTVCGVQVRPVQVSV